MKYISEADFPLGSDWAPKVAFAQHYDQLSAAVATEEVRVVCVETGEGVWRSTEEDYE